eukprot:jgi/Antlo1/481/1467
MAVEDKRGVIPRSISQDSSSMHSPGVFSQELRCMMKAYSLDPLEMRELRPSIIAIVFYCALLSLETIVMAILASFTGSTSYAGLSAFLPVFFVLITFCFVSALVYRLILNREVDYDFLSYVYACMYSVIYIPAAIFLQALFPFLNFLFFFVVVMISQYYISMSLLKDYQFTSHKRQFMFWIACFVLQYATVAAVGMSIANL